MHSLTKFHADNPMTLKVTGDSFKMVAATFLDFRLKRLFDHEFAQRVLFGVYRQNFRLLFHSFRYYS